MRKRDYASVMAESLHRQMLRDEADAITEEAIYRDRDRNVSIDPRYNHVDAFDEQRRQQRARFEQQQRDVEISRRGIVQPNIVLPNGTIVVMPNE